MFQVKMPAVRRKCRYQNASGGFCTTDIFTRIIVVNVSKREVRDCTANQRFTFCRHKYQWVENDSVKIQEGSKY